MKLHLVRGSTTRRSLRRTVIATLDVLRLLQAHGRRALLRDINRIAVGAILGIIIGAGVADAAPGDIDPSFGNGGVLPFTGNVAALPDGRIAVARRTDIGLEFRMFTVNGQLDASWGTAGLTLVPLADSDWFSTSQIAVGADGSMALYGSVDRTVNNTSKTFAAVLKLDATGQPDATFGPNGDGISLIQELPSYLTRLSTVALEPNGFVLIGGNDVVDYPAYDDYCGNGNHVAMARLSPDGRVDTSFGTTGWVGIVDTVESCWFSIIGIRADSSIIVANERTRFWALTNSGVPIAGFGTDGKVSAVDQNPAAVALMPDGGLLLLTGVNSDDQSYTRLVRLDAAGQPEAGFGNGGTLDIKFADLVLNGANTTELANTLRLSPDGQSLFVWVTAYQTGINGSAACSGVAKLHLNGQLDATFGHGGLNCISASTDLNLNVQANGQPLLWNWGATMRLLLDNRPSPGVIDVGGPYYSVNEAAGTVTIKAWRKAGRDGAVSVDYTTLGNSFATSNKDFTATSGRLDWADGEDGERSITVPIVNDSEWEYGSESFSVQLSNSSGGAVLLGTEALISIADDDTPPPPPPQTVQSSQPSSGGAGAMSCVMLWALMMLLCARGRAHLIAKTWNTHAIPHEIITKSRSFRTRWSLS